MCGLGTTALYSGSQEAEVKMLAGADISYEVPGPFLSSWDVQRVQFFAPMELSFLCLTDFQPEIIINI